MACGDTILAQQGACASRPSAGEVPTHFGERCRCLERAADQDAGSEDDEAADHHLEGGAQELVSM